MSEIQIQPWNDPHLHLSKPLAARIINITERAWNDAISMADNRNRIDLWKQEVFVACTEALAAFDRILEYYQKLAIDAGATTVPRQILLLDLKCHDVVQRCLKIAERERTARDGNSDPVWSAADTIINDIREEFGLGKES